MKHVLIAVAVAALALAGNAQTPIGPFAGQHAEDFSGPRQSTFAPCLSYRVFNQSADVCTPGHSGCHTVDSQFFSCNISALSPPYFFVSIEGAVEISFDFEVQRFGGSFGTNQFFPDAAVDFLDVNGAVLASVTASITPDCTWSWQGWDLGPNSLVRKVLITGTPIFGEGFIDMDDLQVDYVGGGGPIVYCTAGMTTHACQPSIAASGNPNVAHTAPCQISVSAVEGQKIGLLFYGVSGANAAPWCTGGSSLLCVKAPTQRTPTQSSGGTINACDGALVLNWNAYQTANPLALGNPWASGSHAYVQGWFRDPPSCKTTNLTNAVVLTYQP